MGKITPLIAVASLYSVELTISMPVFINDSLMIWIVLIRGTEVAQYYA